MGSWGYSTEGRGAASWTPRRRAQGWTLSQSRVSELCCPLGLLFVCRHPSTQGSTLIHPLPSCINLLGPAYLSMLCIPKP